MNIYIVSRWGNPEEGPNGRDTNFLIRAKSEKEAEELANVRFQDLPTGSEDCLVDSRCHHIVQIGIDIISKDNTVIHGPWIENAIINGEYQGWSLDITDGKLKPDKELFAF